MLTKRNKVSQVSIKQSRIKAKIFKWNKECLLYKYIKRYDLPRGRTVMNFYIAKLLCTETNKTKSVNNVNKKTTIIIGDI